MSQAIAARELLREPTVRQMPLTRPDCIHYQFEEQVERTPEAIAVSYQEQSLSYRALNRRANQLAHYLSASGIGPGTLVGLCIERSLTMVISILAVLKAGGGYVPLDPAYPAERLAFMLDDAGMDLLLTQSMAGLSHYTGPAIYTDELWRLSEQESLDNPDSGVSERDMAYVIYTSGSTGLPKGVVIEHKGLGNMIAEQIRIFDVRAVHRIGQFASFSFDASVSEMFMAWLAGAHLCLIPQAWRWPAPVLERYLQAYAITTLTLPPSVLALLPVESLPALQTIISAGETLSSEVATRWTGKQQVFNAYGPTEATVCTTIGRYDGSMSGPSIGYALANMQVYLLDSALQPVAPGAVGELYIGGIGLAQGYLKRPALTAEKFLPHPFSSEPGARLYKTGDLMRMLPDGTLACVGRADRMVKIRGFRIELGEVEAALEQHPLLLHSLVTIYQDRYGLRRLAAYVITHAVYVSEQYALLQKDVGSFLQGKLPAYLLPTVLIALTSFPLTPNGKIDLQALPPAGQDQHKLKYEREEK